MKDIKTEFKDAILERFRLNAFITATEQMIESIAAELSDEQNENCIILRDGKKYKYIATTAGTYTSGDTFVPEACNINVYYAEESKFDDIKKEYDKTEQIDYRTQKEFMKRDFYSVNIDQILDRSMRLNIVGKLFLPNSTK